MPTKTLLETGASRMANNGAHDTATTVPGDRATPDVSLSVAGVAASNSNSYTITGTGFGAKFIGAATFDNFESESVGAASSPIGNLKSGNVTGTTISEIDSNSGSRCLSHDFSVNGFPKIYRELAGARAKGYMSLHVKWSGSNTSTTIFKYGRVGAGGVYSGNPKFGESYTSSGMAPSSFGGEVVTSNGIVGYGANANFKASDPSAIYTPDTWHFYELEWDAGTTGQPDSFFEARCDGQRTITFDGLEFLTAENSSLPDWVLTFINGFDQSPNITALMDDVYIDESRARVVMTNAALYADSTEWAAQGITSYSTTSVITSSEPQSFTVGETAYLHLFNALGVLVSEGNQITVASEGGQ